MQAAGSSKTLATIYQGTRRHIPEGPNTNNDHRENHNSHIQFLLYIFQVGDQLGALALGGKWLAYMRNTV
jgi:hypothetical protein